MAWKKSPSGLIELFDEVLPKDPRAEPRKMFGYPCSFVNGNLWLGLHQDNLLLRLDEPGRAEFLKLPEASLFEPMPGRVMKEYVCAPQALLEEPAELRRWVARSFKHALTLAPKAKKAENKAPKKAPKKATTTVAKKVAKAPAKKVAKAPAKKVAKAPAKKVAKAPAKKVAKKTSHRRR